MLTSIPCSNGVNVEAIEFQPMRRDHALLFAVRTRRCRVSSRLHARFDRCSSISVARRCAIRDLSDLLQVMLPILTLMVTRRTACEFGVKWTTVT